MRAGQAAFGEDGCRKAIARGECGLMLTDGGMSEGSRKKYEALCRGREIPAAQVPEGLIEAATGRTNMAMAIRKGPLLDQVTSCLETENSGTAYHK